jgi:hypothetical protein
MLRHLQPVTLCSRIGKRLQALGPSTFAVTAVCKGVEPLCKPSQVEEELVEEVRRLLRVHPSASQAVR